MKAVTNEEGICLNDESSFQCGALVSSVERVIFHGEF